MKTIQIFFALLFFASTNFGASDGDQKKDAQSLHEQISRTISIDMSSWGWGRIDEFSEYLKDQSLADYNASYAPYLELKAFYKKQFKSTPDPNLEHTEFLLVKYSYNPDADLKEFHDLLSSKNVRDLIYAYATIEDPLKLPRVVPLSVFRPHEATHDNAGYKLTSDTYRDIGDIVHISTEHGTVPLKIEHNNPADGNVGGALAYLGNKPYIRAILETALSKE